MEPVVALELTIADIVKIQEPRDSQTPSRPSQADRSTEVPKEA
jgi:hypothetical protein